MKRWVGLALLLLAAIPARAQSQGPAGNPCSLSFVLSIMGPPQAAVEVPHAYHDTIPGTIFDRNTQPLVAPENPAAPRPQIRRPQIRRIQAAPAAVRPPHVQTAKLAPCCMKVSGAARLPKRFSRERDSYYAGSMIHESPRPAGYQTIIPRVLEVDTDLLPDSVTISDLPVEQRAAHYVAPGNHLTEIGQGATSRVFVTHAPAPVGTTYRGRVALALRRGIEAIKIRTATIFSGEVTNFSRVARYLRSDLIRFSLAKKLTAGMTFEGKRLLDVAEIRSTKAEHARGVLRQEIVNGPSVFELQMHLDCVLAAPPCASAGQSARLLIGSGIAEPGLTGPQAFARIQTKINAIEHFYRDTDEPVRMFVSANGLEDYAGMPKGETDLKKRIDVGFDFNRGQNTHWDPVAGVFKMIDF